ncbi:iron dicitrate transporter FecR [Dyadobacter beijingensis]|uniref:Iron dicitrate transporter FecR n=1 Tax=Dyadobacter beijingensis TaxID=365489 RepID=A0ABQ2IHH6_9BACT|nr:FecR domain-containing protein [Dyadobacter beijingensis]GGN11753.1 iron dicitrate transporter FecR [Dyadobacter beijingensis]
MNTLSVNKALLFQYFAGNASPAQKRLIAGWLAHDGNQELYFEWLAEWQSQSPQFLPDGQERFDAYLRYMRENPNTEKTTETGSAAPVPVVNARRIGRRPWLMAAASVMVLGLTAWLGRGQILYKTYTTEFGETRSVQLSDGTRVILNANTSMRVPRFGFGEKTREVQLNGEAFFNVTHTIDNKRFMVKTEENFEVMVLGTEFSVYTRQKGGKVLLKKGKVHVLFSEGQQKKELVMKPGDLVTMEKAAARPVVKPNADTQKLTAWTGNRFVFDKTPLSEVASQLQEHYGIRVEIKDNRFASRTVSGTFQPESGEELLGLLSELFDFRLAREGEAYLILQK